MTKIFTSEELKKYDGSNGITYIAYEGKVYDVSGSFQWRRGNHQVVHNAGYDLTHALKEAPHSPEFLDRFPIVGEMREDTV